ncbi:MAG TPA: hypothetical protein VIH76_15110 [Candidatus Acidoferrales bacterium]
MVLAAAVMFFQMQVLLPKADVAVATRQELVRYAEDIPAARPIGTFAPIVPRPGTTSTPSAEDGRLADDAGMDKPPNTTPLFPDANTQILSGIYIPDHVAPLPPLSDKHYEAVRTGAPKRLYVAIAQSSTATVNRARRRLKLRRSVKTPRVGSRKAIR